MALSSSKFRNKSFMSHFLRSALIIIYEYFPRSFFKPKTILFHGECSCTCWIEGMQTIFHDFDKFVKFALFSHSNQVLCAFNSQQDVIIISFDGQMLLPTSLVEWFLLEWGKSDQDVF